MYIIIVFIFFVPLTIAATVEAPKLAKPNSKPQKPSDSVSYHRFSGPVSGEIQEVLLANPSKQDPNGKTKDYVAKPDYAYSYGVRDPITGNAQEHQESRDGDAVSGQYTILQADGTMRIVKYTAGGTEGFKAVVEYVRPDGTKQKEEP